MGIIHIAAFGSHPAYVAGVHRLILKYTPPDEIDMAVGEASGAKSYELPLGLYATHWVYFFGAHASGVGHTNEYEQLPFSVTKNGD